MIGPIFELLCVGWNFAAALLLQGSVHVYSKKVEHLYSLVLHALNFISKNRFDFRYLHLPFESFMTVALLFSI